MDSRRQKTKCPKCSPKEEVIVYINGACELSSKIGRVQKGQSSNEDGYDKICILKGRK